MRSSCEALWAFVVGGNRLKGRRVEKGSPYERLART